MKRTNFKQRHDAVEEWKSEAIIQGMPESIIKRVEKDFLNKDQLIRKWEEEAKNFRERGEDEEADLCLDEANELHIEILEYLSIKKIAS